MVLGFVNLMWVVIANTWGRRPVLLISTAITAGSCIWRAESSSYHSFIGAAALSGIGGAPGEIMEPMLITDIMFLHKRGFYNVVYGVMHRMV